MGWAERAQVLRGRSPLGAARLVGRRFVYRKVEMRRYGQRAGDSRAPSRLLELELDLLGPDRFGEVFGTNPHMEPSDPEHFHRQDSTCIVIRDGDRIAASSWMTRGDVYAHELQRTVWVPPGEHLSCRSYVDPDYRGLALLSHMIHGYSAQQDPDDVVWGFVFDWNTHSVRSLERIGWRHTGDYWTRTLFGRQLPGERHFPARPAEHLR